MAKWYELSAIRGIRSAVEEQLDLPPYKGPKDRAETATEFWSRVERAGLLVKALALYDQLAAEGEEWRHIRRETKEEFAARIEREGRQVEVERKRTELVASGLSERDVQEELVACFQPLDGTETRVWETPDPWEHGRLFRRKRDQQELLELADDEDEDDAACRDARWRIECAERRQEERTALKKARRRARELTASKAVEPVQTPVNA